MNLIKSKTPNTAWPFKLDKMQSFAFNKKAFTPQECAKIITSASFIKSDEAKVIVAGGAKHDVKRRSTEITWLQSTDNDMSWVFERLTDLIQDLNEKYFRFKLFGFIEGVQFTRYRVGDFYEPHVDTLYNRPTRKLSITVQLTEPSKYTGGELKLHYSTVLTPTPKEQGTLIVFPSFVLHEVTPVTKGERISLVSWITGPDFN